MTSWLKNILFQTINLHIFTTSEIPPLDKSNKDITSVLHKYFLEEYISNFLLETGIFPNKIAWNFKKVLKSEIFRYERSLMDQSVIKHLIIHDSDFTTLLSIIEQAYQENSDS